MKRVLDVVVASALLSFVWPLLLAISIAVLVTMGPPVLFRQRRTGYGGRVFTLVKIRTMRSSQGVETDEMRMTGLGRLLRGLSLDEMPTLINVIRGDMSLVGPRPLLPRYLDRYTSEQKRRHDVVPGVTGLAQVSGRNALTWEERFALDVWYVDHRSIGLDLWILWRTVGMVLSRRGVSHPGHATMPEFHGSGQTGR